MKGGVMLKCFGVVSNHRQKAKSKAKSFFVGFIIKPFFFLSKLPEGPRLDRERVNGPNLQAVKGLYFFPSDWVALAGLVTKSGLVDCPIFVLKERDWLDVFFVHVIRQN